MSKRSSTTAAAPREVQTVKKKVDERISSMLDHCAKTKHRSLFLLVGDRGKDQIVNLHTMASRSLHSAKLNMLWCMKSEPDFTSTSKKKLEKTGDREIKAGMSTEHSYETFRTFLNQTEIRFCHYKDSHKVLGQTFGMAVLQDFEALTPNILARTIETVQGGGVIVLMLKAMRSLKQLYTMAMDAHARYRTEAQGTVVPRFNERFILSLTKCDTVLCVDDELNVLPLTQKMRHVKDKDGDGTLDVITGRSQMEAQLADLKARLSGNKDVGPLVNHCSTPDQAKVVLALMQGIVEKNLNTTCSVTAARGRGKSAAIGMAVAGAIAQGYSNVFVTAPSPENLNTLFEFVVRGLKELSYVERKDFECMQSTNPDFAKSIVRINVMRGHRQTVQFVSAQDTAKFAPAEIIVIDEAAAIPLPLVQKLLAVNCFTIVSSTIAGYEGTGRALSMKLIKDMKEKGARASAATTSASTTTANGAVSAGGGRLLRELEMIDPIRYAAGDPIEQWLSDLLCLDATKLAVPLTSVPNPANCELYYVNRDALFSFNKKAESMLHRLVSLFVSAHYKNQPNDLQLMSDAPGHHIFALCSPISADNPPADGLPEILCVIHACEEGRISSESLNSNMSKGLRPSGDLIPYTLSQAYIEQGFAKLAGMRVVRIATNPDVQGGGYGSRALDLFVKYFKGEISVVTPAEEEQQDNNKNVESGDWSEAPKPRAAIPALMTPLHQRPMFEGRLDYVGVSYGITVPLFNFWKRAGFNLLYVRQVPNELTAEHSAVMVHPLGGVDITELKRAFLTRFLPLLGISFRALAVDLALSVVVDIPAHSPQKLAQLTSVDDRSGRTLVDQVSQMSPAEAMSYFNSSEMKRLKLFKTSAVELGVILDLVPRLAMSYFQKLIFKGSDGSDGVILSQAESAVLLAMGLQCVPLEDLGNSPTFQGVKQQQLRAFFSKALARIVEHIDRLQSEFRRSGGKRQATSHADEEEDEEENGVVEGEESVQTDSKGNIIGMSISKAAPAKAQGGDGVFRDAKSVGSGAAPVQSGGRKLKKARR